MNDLDDIWTARAALAWLPRLGLPAARTVLAADGPIATLRQLTFPTPKPYWPTGSAISTEPSSPPMPTPRSTPPDGLRPAS